MHLVIIRCDTNPSTSPIFKACHRRCLILCKSCQAAVRVLNGLDSASFSPCGNGGIFSSFGIKTTLAFLQASTRILNLKILRGCVISTLPASRLSEVSNILLQFTFQKNSGAHYRNLRYRIVLLLLLNHHGNVGKYRVCQRACFTIHTKFAGAVLIHPDHFTLHHPYLHDFSLMP